MTPSVAALAFLSQAHGPFINNKFSDAHGEISIEVENPAHATIVASVQAAGLEDVDLAVRAARHAFETGWGVMAPQDRAAILFRFADLLAERAELVGEIESIEGGTPIALSVATVRGFCAGLIRYYGGWATKIEGSTIPAVANGREEQDLLVYTLREPVGVVGAIVPWNAPASMIALKLAPALAAGCTLVLKSAELTPLTAAMFARIWCDAGGPAGAFNVIHGFGADTGAALVRHKGVDKIAFTGSTATGRQIIAAVAEDLRRVSLELGGKSPFVVFPDAVLAEAAPAAAMACFFLSGQNCMAGSRLFLHRSIEDAFLDMLTRFTAGLVIGDPLAPETMIGPLISAAHRAKVEGFVSAALAEGASVHHAPPPPSLAGHFVAPTIVTGVTPKMRIAQEEVFGPVLAVQRFDDDETALARAVDDTRYGLSGSIWTQDLRRAHRFARRIDSGQVGINIHAAVSPETPFGGNRQSGWGGREFGREGLDSYLKTKAVSINLGPRAGLP